MFYFTMQHAFLFFFFTVLAEHLQYIPRAWKQFIKSIITETKRFYNCKQIFVLSTIFNFTIRALTMQGEMRRANISCI